MGWDSDTEPSEQISVEAKQHFLNFNFKGDSLTFRPISLYFFAALEKDMSRKNGANWVATNKTTTHTSRHTTQHNKTRCGDNEILLGWRG